MTTYRLPEALGGGEVEVEIVPNPSVTRRTDNGFVRVLIKTDDESFPIALPFSVLTEVEPPLPPEPDGPAYVVDRDENVWQRRRTGWQRITGGQQSWAELWRDFGPLTRLVPDPFAERIELPWRSGNGAFSITIRDGYVRVLAPGVPVDTGPDGAREMACALWAAADAAGATS
jgi:hypothetical protein